ncbi:glycosyltransferase family 4 protein [uncultured Winogradskyella sp.]|uniref:glycosyltransferase family 4 protein n=1 Tax=uncultured Winogradskyella sp. TaxID=395353 RepID=UPI002622CC66|nr:glycosyltransferase family 4 protein [uncultured Winogradskyella sp.]
MKKIIRITTVPGSLGTLLKGQLRFMSNHYEIVGVSGEGKVLEDVSNNEGIRTIPVNMTRTITPLKDLKALFQLYKIFKKEKPFIVHTHTPKAGTLGMIASKLARVPNRLHTIAGLPLLEAEGKKRNLLNTVEKLTYSCSTMILPNSYGLKDIILSEKFCKEDKLKVIGKGSSNGIDVDHYDTSKVSQQEMQILKSELNILPSDMVFIFVGRIVKDKGINELVQAFVSINEKYPKAKLIVVGPSERELDPIDNVTEELLENHKAIHAVGFIKDIRPYVAISDVLVFPSYREGFPNVVLQANCMGKPCIVSNINGCNEIITDNVNGIIIPPKDIEALKVAMLDVIEKPENLKIMADNSRQNIINKYKREYIWEEMLNLYKHLEK